MMLKSGSIPGKDKEWFSSQRSDRLRGSCKPRVQLVPGAVLLRIKRPGYELDYVPPSRAENKNARSYTSTPPYVFMVLNLITHRDKFAFVYLSYVTK